MYGETFWAGGDQEIMMMRVDGLSLVVVIVGVGCATWLVGDMEVRADG